MIWGSSREIHVTANLEDLGYESWTELQGDVHTAVKNHMHTPVNPDDPNSIPYTTGVSVASQDNGAPMISFAHSRLLRADTTPDNSNERTETYLLRNKMVYDCHDPACVEWIKNFTLMIGYPLYTLFRKILAPIFLSPFYSKEKLHREWSSLMPLKALVGLVAHPILAVLGLLTFGLLSRWFNHLNGDLERWINGHTDAEVALLTKKDRLREMPYLAPCKQPLTALVAGQPEGDTIDIHPSASASILSPVQRRQFLGDLHGYYPEVYVNRQQQPRPPINCPREFGCALS